MEISSAFQGCPHHGKHPSGEKPRIPHSLILAIWLFLNTDIQSEQSRHEVVNSCYWFSSQICKSRQRHIWQHCCWIVKKMSASYLCALLCTFSLSFSFRAFFSQQANKTWDKLCSSLLFKRARCVGQTAQCVQSNKCSQWLLRNSRGSTCRPKRPLSGTRQAVFIFRHANNYFISVAHKPKRHTCCYLYGLFSVIIVKSIQRQ